MKISKVHIGEEILKVVNERLGNKSLFAQKIGKSRSNVGEQVFKRKSIDTDLLVLISDVLEYNFFNLYSEVNKNVMQKDNKPKIHAKIEIELTQEDVIKLGIAEKIKRSL